MLASQGQHEEPDEFDEPVVSSTPDLNDEVDQLPYKCKARKYSPEVKAFMEDFNAKLERLGWIYENPNSRWACPALPVRKGGSNEYRQTADYKPLNHQVEGIAGVMPNLQVDLELVRGSLFFGLFDFIKGYWQIAVDEACQELLSYMTHRKIYNSEASSPRVL
eukprot:jgi/Phyca11/101498/e_gw1.5.1351.1